jgi:hypothetical protein
MLYDAGHYPIRCATMSDVLANVPDLDRRFERLLRHYALISMFGAPSALEGLARALCLK